MTISHVFVDIGGVLGTNGWDRDQNLTPARALGMRCVRFTDATALRSALADVVGASSPTSTR